MQKDLEDIQISTPNENTSEPVASEEPTVTLDEEKISLDGIIIKDVSNEELKLNSENVTPTDSAQSSPCISRSTSSEPLMISPKTKVDTLKALEKKERTFSEAAGDYNPEWKQWSKRSRISNVYKVILYTIIYVFNGLSGNSLAFGLTTFQRETKSNEEDTGWWWTALSLGFMIGTITAGYLFDRFKERGKKQPITKTWYKPTGHKFCMFGILLQIISTSTTCVIKSYWGLVAMYVIGGIGWGFADCAGSLCISWIWGKKATPFVLLVAFGYGLGSFLGPIFGGLAMSRFGDLWGIRITYWSICCVGVIVGLLLIPVRTPKQPSVRMEEAVRGKEQVTVSETPTVSLKEWKFPTCPENWWKIPKRNYIAIYLALHMFTYCIALLSFYGLIGSFVEGKGLCDAATASYLVSSYFIAFTFGRLVNVVVSAFVDARIIIFAFIFGAAIDAIVMISYSNNLLVIWVGTVFMGLFLAPQHPGVLAIPQQSLGVPLTGAMLSIITFGASVGEMVGPAISTSLLKVGLSWDVILWIGFICCSVCVILDLPMMVYLVIQIVKKRKNPIKINEKEIPKTTSQ